MLTTGIMEVKYTVNTTPYIERGWCYFEFSIAADYTRIVNKDHVEEADRAEHGFYIRNGIVVVVKNASIPDGSVI